jgi:hypothetical protein
LEITSKVNSNEETAEPKQKTSKTPTRVIQTRVPFKSPIYKIDLLARKSASRQLYTTKSQTRSSLGFATGSALQEMTKRSKRSARRYSPDLRKSPV